MNKDLFYVCLMIFSMVAFFSIWIVDNDQVKKNKREVEKEIMKLISVR